jgi:hypothetical protein
MKKLLIICVIIAWIVAANACYKNRYDITTEFTAISLTTDVAPILTSGGCGCHNNGTTRQFAFSNKDTIFYQTMIAKAPMLEKMAKGEPHPAEGSVFFTPSQASIVKRWVEQGAQNDFVPAPITGPVSYQKHITPLYKQSCTGGQCHGGLGPTLDYTIMKSNQDKLMTMMESLGKQGHDPVINIPQATATVFIAWINGGCQP